MENIVLSVLIHDETLSPKNLLKVIDDIESALYHSDRADIEFLFDEILRSHDFPAEEITVVRDACLERLREFRHERVRLSAINKGSFELVAVTAAVAFVVAKMTIIESGKRAWRDSLWDHASSVFFEKIFNFKPSKIAQFIRGAPRILRHAHVLQDGRRIRVEITIDSSGKHKRVKLIGEITERDRTELD
jgi:hypothetical protein